MSILAFSNCPLRAELGSGRTRIAWSEGLREFGHNVEVWDSCLLLRQAGDVRARRLRLGLKALSVLFASDVRATDIVEFFGAEFWLPTFFLSFLPARRRPLLIAHSDGLEPAYSESLQRNGGSTGGAGVFGRTLTSLSDLAFTRSDKFVTASASDARYAKRRGFYGDGEIAIVRLGLDSEYLPEDPPLPEAERERRVVFLGRWESGKGKECVVNVCQPLLKQDRGMLLSLLGVCKTEDAVLQEFDSDVRRQITVKARLSATEIATALRNAKVFFLPTQYEGFGLANAEAMASGCAVVTTPTGFAAEVVPGEEAVICPFGDEIGMRVAIERLLTDDSYRCSIATAGQRRARQLRWPESVGKLENLYSRWTAEHFGRIS